MVDKLDAFIEESRKLIGKEVEESQPSYTTVHKKASDFFCLAIGSENTLFLDAAYGANSRYYCPLAPQTFLAAVRYPASEGAYCKEDYELAKFFTAAEFEWNDVIRWGDKFTTELKLTDVLEDIVENKRVAKPVSEGHYWRRNKDLVGTCKGTMSMIPFKRGEEMLSDRDIHVYSDDEIARIVKDEDNEVYRGDATLYWEEVNEGDKLMPVVKGPVSHPDLFIWRGMIAPVNYCLEVMYRRTLKEPGKRRTNPVTNWPYWHADLLQEDLFSCKLNGMTQMWIHGLQRVCFAEDLFTKWMSDDGFIRRLNIEILKPFIYQDANWYNGEIVDKYKERLGDVMYKAVDIKIDVTNQRGEKTASGDATVYLPSKGCEVKLPVPQ